MNILHKCLSPLAVLAGVFLMLLLAAMPAAGADNTGPDCSRKSIEATFSARYPRVTGARDPAVEEIQASLKKSGFDPNGVDGWLGRRTYNALAQFCKAFETEVRSTLLQQGTSAHPANELADILVNLLLRPYLAKLLTQQEGQPKEILLNGGGCGCSRDFDKLVYGFFPYWLADGKEHIVDFSLYDRIGYFALNLNEHGHITNRLHFPADVASLPNIARFINEAHKYRVKVDVTFVASTWQSWNADQINNAADNVVETVTRKYQTEEPAWWRKRLPFVDDNSTVNADGINLYFDRYERPEQGKILTRIVEEIRLKLKQVNSDAKLNLLLGFNLKNLDRKVLSDKEQSAQQIENKLGKIIGQFRALEKRFDALGDILVSETEMVDNVFMFLSDDTSRSKKDLRQLIENAFDGDARRTVLRKMVPIVTVQGLAAKDPVGAKAEEKKDGSKSAGKSAGQASQFDDDLIYAQDNFGGIGLWRLPLLEDAEVAAEKNIADGGSGEGDAKTDSAANGGAEKAGAASAGVDTPAAENTALAEAKQKLEQAKAAVLNEVALQEAAEKDLEEKKSALEKAGGTVEQAGDDTEANKAKVKKAETDLNAAQEKLIAAQEKLTAAEKKLADVKSEVQSPPSKIKAEEEHVATMQAALKRAQDEVDKATTAHAKATEPVNEAKTAVEAASKNVDTANAALEKAKADLTEARQAVEAATAVAKTAEGEAGKTKADKEKVAAEKMATQADVNTLRVALQSNLQRSSQFALLGPGFEAFEFNLCAWACPNRWVFRIAFDVLVVLALLYALCAWADCRLREFYQRRFIWFAGFGFIIAMVFAVSAVCDPFLKENAVVALVGIPLLILAGWGISRLRKMNQPLLP